MGRRLGFDVSVSAGPVRVLPRDEEYLLRPLLDRDPVKHCFAASRLSAMGTNSSETGGRVLAHRRDGERHIDSALLLGANLVPIETTPESRTALAGHALARGRRCSSLVGPAGEVLDIWERLSGGWGPAREVRPEQPLLVAREPSSVAPDPLVRRVRPEEMPALFPACVAMFTEEVGVSPLAGGAGPSYERRISELVAAGRAFARFENGQLVFKAEIGALSEHACQIQGVWVRPGLRGRGLGTIGMAAVVGFARQLVPEVSLFVNSFNEAALTSYERVGFRRRGMFASVLLG